MRYFSLFLGFAYFVFLPNLAFAHHPLGGELPANFWHGLLSGLFHPIIGLDHFAFIVAVGILSAVMGMRFLLPFIFIVGTIGGTILHVYGFNLWQVEFLIALSLVIFGFVLANNLTKEFFTKQFFILFLLAGFFGLCHGFGFGEAVYGAEPTPIVAYLLGFAFVEYVLSFLFGLLVVGMGGGYLPKLNMSARLAGAMVLGAGMLLVGEHVVGFMGL